MRQNEMDHFPVWNTAIKQNQRQLGFKLCQLRVKLYQFEFKLRQSAVFPRQLAFTLRRRRGNSLSCLVELSETC